MPDEDRRDGALLRILCDVYRAEEPGDRLTPAESRCLQAASRGLEVTEAAVLLGIAPDTVKTHLKHARRRLRAKNTAHACCEAIRFGLIP